MRRRTARAAAVVVLFALGAACSTTAPAPAPVPSLVEAKRQVAEYVASGRYDADLAAVVGSRQD